MLDKAASNSSNQNLHFYKKLKEWSQLFWMRSKGLFKENNFEFLFEKLEEYQVYLQKYSSKPVQDTKVLEIGFGARPNRLILLNSIGFDAIGVDLDQPVLFGSPSEFINIYKRNGIERTFKSIVRFFLFDGHERNCLADSLCARGFNLTINKEKFFVNDVADPEFQKHIKEQSLDLIISEDVFEHIPLSSLKTVVPKMAQWLQPNGIALIRPCIYTGITGGHLLEWYPPLTKDFQRKSEAWEHLRKKRYQANTYLNQMSRADYRELFTPYFHIVQEKVEIPNLGREFLCSETLNELKDFSEEELFSNTVLFVLKPKLR